MESVFLYAIPAAPRPHLTHALSSHIYHAVCQGTREDYGIPVSQAVLAAQARLYLGRSYADAIGLPPVTWAHTLLALTRLAMLRLVFGPYFLLAAVDETRPSSRLARVCALMHTKIIRVIYDAVFRRSFAALVDRVRASQPACRFGRDRAT